MRELKFRAWDKKNKEWLGESDPNALTYHGFHLFGEATLMQRIPIERLQDLVIMQFTGLVDRLGEDIYEGDLCWDAHDETLGEVIWHEGSWMYKWENIIENLHDYTYALEVIGNVHENPEKIKEIK